MKTPKKFQQDNDRKKLFKELKARNAGCIEMAWNGFVNLYTEDKPCEGVDCKKDRENG